MKQVTRYQADDGTLFEKETDCLKYEKRRSMLDKIYEDLRGADPDVIYDWILENTKGFK